VSDTDSPAGAVSAVSMRKLYHPCNALNNRPKGQ